MMKSNRSANATNKTQVTVLTDDAAFAEQARATFGASGQIGVTVVPSKISTVGGQFDSGTRIRKAIDDLFLQELGKQRSQSHSPIFIGQVPLWDTC